MAEDCGEERAFRVVPYDRTGGEDRPRKLAEEEWEFVLARWDDDVTEFSDARGIFLRGENEIAQPLTR